MTTLKDALYNLSPESGSSPEYAKGVLVGVVAAMMEAGPYTFHEAVAEVAPYLPKAVMPEAVPNGWGLDLVWNGAVTASAAGTPTPAAGGRSSPARASS